jgi:peptidylprolyl isomerase
MQIKKGDTIKVHYVGTLDDGSQFDSSYERGEPLEFQTGVGMMIPGFDNGVMGMSVGDKKTINILPTDAYGERIDEAVQSISKQNFPPDFEPVVGSLVEGSNGDGMPLRAIIQGSDEENIILDFNHPLAGKELTFNVEILEITES